MTKKAYSSDVIRNFILHHAEQYPLDLGKKTALHFNISRQAVNKHFKKLVLEGLLSQSGVTKNTVYHLAVLSQSSFRYDITPDLAEDVVWRESISKELGNLPENVMDIWHYGFTEMFNNAIDHSEGSEIVVTIKRNAINSEIFISDNGLGIFKRIQSQLNLLDERHALLELSKGKLTTDPSKHSGQGIFFTSRMFDGYDILSSNVYFSHNSNWQEDLLLKRHELQKGTTVWLKLNNHSQRTTKKIFDEYASPQDDYEFNKTVVPVRLAQYGNDKLVSRSQAKRLLSRIDLFKIVLFDFQGVDMIGQAFADEIFRVFALQHPEMEFRVIHATSEIKKMISRAQIELQKK